MNMSTFGVVTGQMDTMPLWAFVLANSLVIIEFLVDCATILISIPIFYLIWRTSILHRNLKSILLCQSCVILGYALLKVFFTIPLKFISGDIFWIERVFLPSQIAIFSIVYARIMLPFMIILERTLASIYAKKYEKQNWHFFNCSWFIVMMLFIVGNVFIQQQQTDPSKESLANLLNSYIIAILTCIEILIFAVLWKYNKKKYIEGNQIQAPGHSSQATGLHQYDLNEKYQFLENIRTALQLAPALFFYLLNAINSIFLGTFIKYCVITDAIFIDEIVVTASILVTSSLNLLMQITIIFWHPILKRNFVSIFPKFRQQMTNNNNNNNANNRVHPVPPQTAENNDDDLETGTKRTEMATQETEEHFRILGRYWN